MWHDEILAEIYKYREEYTKSLALLNGNDF